MAPPWLDVLDETIHACTARGRRDLVRLLEDRRTQLLDPRLRVLVVGTRLNYVFGQGQAPRFARDARLIRIFNCRWEQIAVHVRQEPGRFSTHGQHVAKEKISGLERGADYLLGKVSAIGSQTQRPLAIVVVGGMITTLFLTRYLMPVLYSFYGNRQPPQVGGMAH